MQSKMEMIRALRLLTNQKASMADCKNALSDTGGDLDQAEVLLGSRGFIDCPKGVTGMNAEIPADAPDGWAYLLAKVNLYLRMGADAYRKGDALQMPDITWGPDTLLEINECFQEFVDPPFHRCFGHCLPDTALTGAGQAPGWRIQGPAQCRNPGQSTCGTNRSGS